MAEYELIHKDGKTRPAHVVLMERILGRPLKDNEVVHHINGDKRDNSPENLQVMDRGNTAGFIIPVFHPQQGRLLRCVAPSPEDRLPEECLTGSRFGILLKS